MTAPPIYRHRTWVTRADRPCDVEGCDRQVTNAVTQATYVVSAYCNEHYAIGDGRWKALNAPYAEWRALHGPR